MAISKVSADHHTKAAEHHTAAEHHATAAQHHSSGDTEKAGLHAHIARGHEVQADEHSKEASKAHANDHKPSKASSKK